MVLDRRLSMRHPGGVSETQNPISFIRAPLMSSGRQKTQGFLNKLKI